MDLITNNDDIGAEVTQSRVNNHLKLTVRVIQVARSASGYRNPWWAHVAPMEGKSAISDEPIEYVLWKKPPDLDRIRAQGSTAAAEDAPEWTHHDERKSTIFVPETPPESEIEEGESDGDGNHHHQSSTAATTRASKRRSAIGHLSDAEEGAQARKKPRVDRA
ncbi:hypothetical protein CPB97_011272 [Podila verticillata]|nr:hypothetical protein CPB97_011272 [Podila verticillata]